MAKDKLIYVCGECGYETAKWMGKCPQCGSWNTLMEDTAVKVQLPRENARAVKLSAVSGAIAKRSSTGIAELDRVLGGGLLPGMAVLLGGDPGIGKSTLLLQAADALAKSANVLYVSGEESGAQIKLRAERLGVKSDFSLLCGTGIAAILDEARSSKCDVLIIDSIQTMESDESESAPGSVSQVRAATVQLTRYAKDTGTVVLIVGHVTKDGAIAGPRVLEHIVDTVLYFEGDRHEGLRLLRAVKNRFGSTNEVGVFEMTDEGMREVPDPSRLFLSGEQAAGCAVTCLVEGSRPLLCEVQSLVTNTAFSSPRRAAAGVDNGRLALLLAVLEKKAHLRLTDKDVYINVVGNLVLSERGADLALTLCIASALSDTALPAHTAAIGEVGLTGELRPVSQTDARIRECARLGYTNIIVPKTVHAKAPDGAKLLRISSIGEAIAHCAADAVKHTV